MQTKDFIFLILLTVGAVAFISYGSISGESLGENQSPIALNEGADSLSTPLEEDIVIRGKKVLDDKLPTSLDEAAEQDLNSETAIDLGGESSQENQAVQNQQKQIKQYDAPPAMQLQEGVDYKVKLKTTMGDILLDLYETQTPITVNNFVFLAKEGFYNGTPFHRVVKGFMIQGGDPTGTGRAGPGYTFADEEFDGEYVPGTLAMANAGPNTNGSQFFIMAGNTPLPPNYVIFGAAQSQEDLDVVLSIADIPVGPSSSNEMSKPLDPVFITGVEIYETEILQGPVPEDEQSSD